MQIRSEGQVLRSETGSMTPLSKNGSQKSPVEEVEETKMRLFEICLAVLIVALAAAGVGLVVFGTGSNGARGYLVPPQILPGLCVLYACAVLAAVAVSTVKSSASLFTRPNKFVANRIDEAGRKAQRNMFLLLTFFIILSSTMTDGAPAMYRALTTNYPISLFANLLVSVIASVGLFGWLATLKLRQTMTKVA